jgi:hypothetical protein
MKLLQSYLKNKPSSQSPLGIVNHEFFLKKIQLKLQASSYRRAGGTQKVQAPGVGGPIVHKQLTGGWAHSSQATYPQVIHRKDI